MSPASRVAIVVVILAVVGGAFWWGRRQSSAPPPPAPPVAQPAVTPPPPPPAAPAKPAVAHPLEPAEHAALPNLDGSDDFLKKAFDELLGHKAPPGFLIADGLARRFVATVNNLGTDSAAASLWPIERTPGRFETAAGGDGTIVADKNADRYTPFVRLVDAVNTQHAAALYRRVYPLLQRAYEELGFPGQYFNDRVVEVIDQLVATPEVSGPIKVKRVTAAGAAPPPPGAPGLYIYDDPSLESRTAGQKILLRMGAANARTLKAKLADLRRHIAKNGPSAAAAR